MKNETRTLHIELRPNASSVARLARRHFLPPTEPGKRDGLGQAYQHPVRPARPRTSAYSPGVVLHNLWGERVSINVRDFILSRYASRFKWLSDQFDKMTTAQAIRFLEDLELYKEPNDELLPLSVLVERAMK